MPKKSAASLQLSLADDFVFNMNYNMSEEDPIIMLAKLFGKMGKKVKNAKQSPKAKKKTKKSSKALTKSPKKNVSKKEPVKKDPPQKTKAPKVAPAPTLKAPVASRKTLAQAAKVVPVSKKQKPTVSTKPAMPVLKVVLCGPHSVHWLPIDTAVHPLLMEEGLHKDEVELGKKMKAPLRKQEFLRARWLSRRMLKIKEPLLKDEHGAPIWPPNILGSISHKDGHVVVVKVSQDTHHAVGLDIEKLSKVNEAIETKICNEDERGMIDRVAALARMSRRDVLALIFAFKESVYKTHFPTGKTQFGFLDATITEIAYDRREIFARMNIDTSPHSKAGHVTIGFYNWIDYGGEKYVVVVAEERKPLVIDQNLKAELLSDS